jgi:hypothetical protein
MLFMPVPEKGDRMTTEAFNRVLNERIKKMTAILGEKAKEYARGDRLSNFKKAAMMMDTTPENACRGMWAKHVISICDLINDSDAGKDVPMAMWQEKIGDAINYLVLLEALVIELGARNA